MSSNEKRDKPAEKADGVVEIALTKLCKRFCGSPTRFLEEKHLHNEFDQILRELVRNDNRFSETVETEDKIEFPLIMNEYATVHHYSRDSFFEEPMDDKDKEERWGSGSLDYVWLWDKWVGTNSYCTAVNKDADFRRGEKGEGKGNPHDTDRYLVVVEFKFDHYASYMATMDKKNNDDKGKPWQSSITSALEKMKKDMQTDLNKVCHEEPPYGHVVYFNSRIPLPEQMDEASHSKEEPTSVSDVFNTLKQPRANHQIMLWYAQGGVKNRFNDEQTWAGKTRCKTSSNSSCQLEIV